MQKKNFACYFDIVGSASYEGLRTMYTRELYNMHQTPTV